MITMMIVMMMTMMTMMMMMMIVPAVGSLVKVTISLGLDGFVTLKKTR